MKKQTNKPQLNYLKYILLRLAIFIFSQAYIELPQYKSSSFRS